MGYALEKLQVVNELSYVTCCVCGTAFAMEKLLNANVRENHQSFYCPNGHAQSYRGKSEAELLRERLVRTETSLACERDLRLSTERTLARTKKRIANGVCPCCKRSFSNLRAHMAHKHPDMAKKVPTQI